MNHPRSFGLMGCANSASRGEVAKRRARHAAEGRRGFTLLEVMIAIAVLAIALMALLALDHQDLQSVIRAQDLSRAAMLAQTLMTQVEIGPLPQVGTRSGDFRSFYQGRFPNFRWQQIVARSSVFPDVEEVKIVVFYGPGFGRRFELGEFLHNPQPIEGG
jgi:general secretion pathway protein I